MGCWKVVADGLVYTWSQVTGLGLQLSWLEHCVDNAGVVGSRPTRPTNVVKQRRPTSFWFWGCSSAGRAAALQAVGSGFESCHLHQSLLLASYLYRISGIQHQSCFERGGFVVDQDLLINRLFFNNLQSLISVASGNCTFVKVQCRPCRQQQILIASK